jgi:hypothetical protein
MSKAAARLTIQIRFEAIPISVAQQLRHRTTQAQQEKNDVNP